MWSLRWLRVPVWIAAVVLAGWVADLLVPGLRIDGSVTARLVVGGAVATIPLLLVMAAASAAGIVTAVVRAARYRRALMDSASGSSSGLRLLPPAGSPPPGSTSTSGPVARTTGVFRWQQRSGDELPERSDDHG